MNGVIIILIIFLSGMIGIVCDLKFNVTSPLFYWTLGLIGGILAVIWEVIL